MTDVQVEQDEAPPRLSRRRRAARLVLVALTVVCSLSLVLSPRATPPAAALIPAIPVAVGASAAAPIAGTVLTGTGMLATGGIGLAIMGAYVTRDTWVPVVRDWLGIGKGGSQAHTGCVVAGSFVAVGENSFNANVQWSGCGLAGPGSGTTRSREIRYQCGNGNAISSHSTNGGSTYFDGQSGSKTLGISCSTGYRPVHAEFRMLDIVRFWWDFAYDDSLFESTTSTECLDIATGTKQTITATEGGAEATGRMVIPSCQEKLGMGWVPTRVTSDSGRTGAAKVRDLDVSFDAHERYPNCFTVDGVTCRVRVFINGDACTASDPACHNWQEYAQNYPSRVQCRFGSYVVSMPSCDPLRGSYVPGATPVEVTQPITTPNGWPTSNPTTNPNPSPSPSPSPTAGPAAPPLSGPNPEGPPTPGPDGPTDNPEGRDCWGENWSWNPVSWVYTPVKCALSWAFIPQTGVGPRIDNIRGGLDGKMPFALLGGIPVGVAIGDNGCPDWVLHVGTYSQNIVCSSEFVAMVRTSRPWLAAGMILVAFWPLVRGMVYASVPLIKPVPTSSDR